MDNHNAGFLIWLIISLVTCMKCMDFSDASSTINPLQHKEDTGTIHQRGANDSLDVYPLRFGSYQYAMYRNYINHEAKIIGIKGNLNIWLIKVNEMDFSGSQISLGTYHQGQGIHFSAGWMVNVQKFHDDYPRLFASYTTDNFTTVCYTFDACNGFVVKEARGFTTPIERGSVYDGEQSYITMRIEQEPVSKNWELRISKNLQSKFIGYWPSSFFPALNEGPSIVEWGGFVFRSQLSPGPTPMGNGGLPTLGYKKACYIGFIRYKKKDHEFVSPSNLTAYQSEPNVYALSPLYQNTEYGTHFFYGGLWHQSRS